MSKYLCEIRVYYEDDTFDSFSPACGWSLSKVIESITDDGYFDEVERIVLNYDERD